MAFPENRQRAKELVQNIADDHGYLVEEDFQGMSSARRQRFEQALKRKDEMIGSGVIKLAKNLYTSKARFVFELLQNADDNSFSRAAARAEVPSISFYVFPRRIIVECNEDGFTEENLKAICAVGESSKSGSEGYIGEKGIGFKSVFMAAWKAHIQSGAFSFSFSHRDDDSGMGMISPVWEDDFEEFDSPLTRLTLDLHDTDTLQNAQDIQNQFQELQETFLLFMKNLKMICVVFHDANEEETSSVRYFVERQEPNHATLRRIKVANMRRDTSVKHYHVTIHQATDIPETKNRTYFNGAPSTSQVVLAFPLSATSGPIIQPQDIFVYLPVRPMGFKFIIQADFVTDGSRQDIVRDSNRNIALLNGVADAFSKAVSQFCEHDGLRLQWMRYLPDRKDENWGTFWGSLVDKIAQRLSTTYVIYCHKRFDRHLIEDLVRLTDDVYADGEPLFEDGDQEEIVSQQYDKNDLAILKNYGLRFANFKYIIKWLKTDLNRGTQSRMRSATTTDNWHTQAARLLHLPFSKNWDLQKLELKRLALLPLNSGTWVSTMSGPVFFAKVNGIDIPLGTGLQIVDGTITNPHRITLFEDLGVQKAALALVRRRIFEIYGELGHPRHISLQSSRQHLEFLYLTHQSKEAKEPSYSNIILFDEDGRIFKPSETVMYPATDRSPYSPWELLKESGSASGTGYRAPGFMAHRFLNEEYFAESPSNPAGQSLSWTEWFHRHLKIPNYVHLGDTHLSDAAAYLAEHRPDRFLGALRIHSRHNRNLSPEFIARVQGTKVLCGGDERRLKELKETYFPTNRLKSIVERFVKPGAFFPWLQVEGETRHDAVPEMWDSLLNKIGVGKPVDDLDFALAMLRYTVQALRDDSDLEGIIRLFSLYSYIQAQYRVYGGSSEAKLAIRAAFTNEEAIYIPSANFNDWESPEACVWDAIQELDTKYALRIYYDALPFLNQDSKRDLEQLFSNTLGISDCTLAIYVDELKRLQNEESEQSDIICALYHEIYRLWMMETTQNMSRNWLRREFEDHTLIYVGLEDGPSWRKISQCVWSTAARLRDMVSLNDEYEGLEDLFVKTLGVRPVTLSMAIDELKGAAGRHPISVEEVKASLLTVNSLLCSESYLLQPDLMESNIFPVGYPEGGVQCVSAQTQFFIVDRESLRSSFGDRVKLLDFSLEEVVQLYPFLSWVGIEDRYISRCVRESTSVQESSTHPISKHRHEFRYRAHAILRIAEHFESPRVTTARDTNAFYELLQNARIFAADTISLELSLSQDGVPYKALGGPMNMHLDEASSSLSIYLPRKKIPQQYAFNKHLPERLLQWIMTEKVSQIRHGMSDRAVIAIKDVWNTHLATLSTTLDECGIITISTPNVDPEVEDDSSSDSDPDADPEEVMSDQSCSQSSTQNGDHDIGTHSEDRHSPRSALGVSPLEIAGTYSENDSLEYAIGLVTQNDRITLPVRSAAPDREPVPLQPSMIRGDRSVSLESVLAHDDHYLNVLENAIASAAMGTIPNRNEKSVNVIGAGWRGLSRISGATQFEKDCKVGAAGELFVFELLSHLDPALPNFSRDNWKSNMRQYAMVHPAYANMSPWTGTETSDITYTDTQGILTDLLIRKHYLERNSWAGKTPHYFIEVKATRSAYNAPFFMSKAQYERMQNATLSGGKTSVIYVIFRVYQTNQGDGGSGLKVYVDPEALRSSRELKFTPQSWSVVPGANASQE